MYESPFEVYDELKLRPAVNSSLLNLIKVSSGLEKMPLARALDGGCDDRGGFLEGVVCCFPSAFVSCLIQLESGQESICRAALLRISGIFD